MTDFDLQDKQKLKKVEEDSMKWDRKANNCSGIVFEVVVHWRKNIK